MKIAFLVLGAAVGTFALLAALHMLAASHFAPRWLARLNYTTADPSAARSRTALAWVYFLAAVAGFGTMAYAGTSAVLWWIPYSVGMSDEDGGFTPVRVAIAVLVSLWVGFHLPTLLCRFVENTNRPD